MNITVNDHLTQTRVIERIEYKQLGIVAMMYLIVAKKTEIN